MKKRQILLKFMIISLLFFSCNQKDKFQEFSFDGFSMFLPSSWKKIKVKGIDSNVNIIVTKNNDSIYFDLGQYSQEFNETKKVFSKEQIRKYDSLKMNTNGLHYSDTPEIDQAQGTFLKEYYYYDTINKKVAKIKVPKKYKLGETGIYFSKINNNALSIVGKNLNKEEQEILVESFKTIKFK
ncbi:hypothetical protein QQY79_17805 [Flavobacterium tructae]|uniref:hypothetical protein n=1 Tax=Flavobacterium tructae TaxID=1114873 RepID=UPI002551F685|nr:hypothetical protein [Flavobacterium tructae]MDL2144387.1 hypothetical protein [Flavobacterium tructae]